MSKAGNLFVKGNSGVGKTTMILRCIQPFQKEIGGFFTQRIVGLHGETLGFTLVSAEEVLEPTRIYSKDIENVFIRKENDGWKKDTTVFVEKGIQILESAIKAKKQLLIMDEIGGVELKEKEFRIQLDKVLGGEIPCLGVLKNERNYESMKTRVFLDSELDYIRMQLEEDIKVKYQGTILNYSKGNSYELENRIRTFIERQKVRG